MPSEISPICPVCGQLDAVRKVVSIVSEGISTTEYSMPTVWQWQGKIYSGVQRHTASSMSTLALRLLPPAPPEKKQVSLGWVILPFVVLWLLPTLLSGKRLFYPYMGEQGVFAPTFSGVTRASQETRL